MRGATPRRALADKERLLELDERRARARANLLAVAATEQLEAAVRAEQQAEAVVRAGWRLSSAAQERFSPVVFLFVSPCCCSLPQRQARLDELDRKATNLGFKPRLKGGRKLGQGADAAVPSE